jgi:hypothetical protein
MRVPIPRVDTLDLSIFGPTTAESSIEWLDLQIDSHVFSIPVVPQTVVARPPSIQLQPLYPKWTLQSIRRQTPNLVPKEFRTIVQLRKLFGKWEFYVSCAGYANQSHVGGETVVFYNPITHNTLNIIPTPLASSSDGWSASIEVPIEWIDNDTLQFSVVRKHGASTFVEEGPIPCIPWRNSYPTPIVVDLSQWDVIDRFPDSR